MTTDLTQTDPAHARIDQGGEKFMAKPPVTVHGAALLTGGFLGTVRLGGIPVFHREYPEAVSAEAASSYVTRDVARGLRVLFDELIEDASI